MSDEELQRLGDDFVARFEIEELRKASNEFLASLTPEKRRVVEASCRVVGRKARAEGRGVLFALQAEGEYLVVVGLPSGKVHPLSEDLFYRLCKASGIDVED